MNWRWMVSVRIRYHAWRIRPTAWMYIDETESLNGQFVGASAILVTANGRRNLKVVTEGFRKTLPGQGISPTVEIHAADWVNKREYFPNTNAFTRISALGTYLRMMSKAKGVEVINIIVDTHQPGVTPRIRELIFETLFWEFELYLTRNRKIGLTLFDKNQVAQVVAIARRLQKDSLRRQPALPQPAASHDHDGLQLADVCAYFALQRSTTPATQVKKAGAANYLDRIARLCPSPSDPSVALIRDLQ